MEADEERSWLGVAGGKDELGKWLFTGKGASAVGVATALG